MSKTSKKTRLVIPNVSLKKKKSILSSIKDLSLKTLAQVQKDAKTLKKFASSHGLNTRQKNSIPEAIDELCQQFGYADTSELSSEDWDKIRVNI